MRSVRNTRIFASKLPDDRQSLVYEMSVQFEESLAMVLPLPVRLPTHEGAVEFVDLSDYPGFFADLERGFPAEESLSLAPPLAVQLVGSFEASYVPSVADFSRLDPRFRLGPEIWERLAGYFDYGFAVFKLRPNSRKVHPMALTFPSRAPLQLFFPTTHVHDGTVPTRAQFDHNLYLQRAVAPAGWRPSAGPARGFVDEKRARGLVDPAQGCWRRVLAGELHNGDTVV